MAVHLSFLLVVSGLTGIHSITTVSKVSVKAGDSITIPCLYGSKYKNHVKYLCQGYYWKHCSYVAKTNQQQTRFSIFDDKTQNIFTVTIKDVTEADAHYWCAVEIDGAADIGQYFHLSVTTGLTSLYVDHQRIIGFKGDSVTISCYYRSSGEMKWCRLGGACVTGSAGSIDGTRVTISASVPSVFTVTMSGLTTESRGWYLCVKEDLQMPVHLTVTEKPTTSTIATTTRLTTLSSTFGPVNLTLVTGNEETTTVQLEEHSVSADLRRIIICLSLLIFIVMTTFFLWFYLKKQKQHKAASLSMTEAEEEPTYCNIDHTRGHSSQRPYAESDVDVIYSSVVPIRQINVHRQVESNNENVIYSTLA